MARQEPATFESGWQRRFRNFAELKDDDAGIAGWSPNGLACRLRNFSLLWRDKAPEGAWLDAGCGAGTYCRFLAAKNLRVVGVDYSLPTLCKAERRSSQGIVWALGDVTRLPLKTGAYSGALCFGVLQALSTSDAAVGELARVVRPGGEVWIDALNASCLPHVWERLSRKLRGVPMHLRYEYPSRVRQLMRAHGLVDTRVDWIPILPQRWARFQPLVESGVVRWMLRYIPLLGALFSHAFIVRGRRAPTGTNDLEVRVGR